METSRPVNVLPGDADRMERARQAGQYRRLGLWNGLLIGLALAGGVWLPQIVRLTDVPVNNRYGSIVLAGLLAIGFCAFLGWLTARIGKTLFTFPLWAVAGIALALLIAYQPSFLRNLIIWVSDSRFAGRTIYPGLEATVFGLVLSGFFIILVLAILGILQDYRLEGVQQALGVGGRLTTGAVMRLLAPAPIVAIAGLVTANIYGGAASPQALELVDRAILRVQAYQGDDLFELGNQEGINYSALRGVRDQLAGDYSLILGETDAAMSLTVVAALFDNGAWISCQIINEQLTFCADAAGPYTVGLASLITGEPIPESCRFCLPEADQELVSWLAEQGRAFDGAPEISRVVQRGSQVLMRVADADGSPVFSCWFAGNAPVALESCQIEEE